MTVSWCHISNSRAYVMGS